MGLELIAACAVSCVAAVTFDKVVLPRAFSQYEKKVEQETKSKTVFLHISEKTKA